MRRLDDSGLRLFPAGSACSSALAVNLGRRVSPAAVCGGLTPWRTGVAGTVLRPADILHCVRFEVPAQPASCSPHGA